ncbi:hypothetical protein BRD17_00260 [Halobacteriales archaeon SW_7_68_16]|nr:MAG: hypothetical protein BRD17_00260 [Halobacteriales archaeon SW_7_68_16]
MDLERWSTINGEDLDVDRGETGRGSKALSFVASRGRTRDRQYGWVCGTCDTTATARHDGPRRMDRLWQLPETGRVERRPRLTIRSSEPLFF